jgi:glutathione S-transferase
MLRILGKASSINVRKVLWTCAELARAYELEEWGTGFRSTREPSFLALNPNGLVPVMVDGDVVLWESNTICRYLAASAGRDDLLPSAPSERARVEQWMDWQATELNSAWRYAFMGLVRQSESYADPEAIAASARAWNEMMMLLDRQLAATGAFAVGPKLTLADIVLGLSTHRWLMTPIGRPSLRAVEAYYARLSQRPAFVQNVRGIP